MNRKWLTFSGIVGVTIVLVIFGIVSWRNGHIHPSTDNAYIGGDVTTVAPRVAGTIARVAVHEHQRVHAGDVVAEIDPRDYDQALARERASLAAAEAALELQRARIEGARANREAARARAELARADLERFRALEEKGSTARRQYEQARAAARVAEAQVAAARKALSAEEVALRVKETAVDRARAGVESAELTRSYCTIVAPCDGVVANLAAKPGQVAAPGQPLCRIAQLEPEHVWVDANFKETQLERVRVGQPARIRIDAAGDHEYRGHVASLDAGTGAAFSLLPPENATGNWVKVVQRLPVRIRFDEPVPDNVLRLGLSCEVTVDTSDRGDEAREDR